MTSLSDLKCTEILMRLLTVWSFCHSSDLLPVGSEDNEVACGGISHMVFSDILVPLMDGTAEHIKVCSCV